MDASPVVAVSVRLWLVRHGATIRTGESLSGWSDVPLSSEGREQAGALGERLRRRSFDGRWTSDLPRARETARIAVGGAQPDARLRELDFGDLEGRRWGEIAPSVQAALLRFDGARPPGGESVEELRGRVEAFLSTLVPGRHLVFTHGGVIRMLLRERGCDRVVAPGSITILPWRGAGG